MIPWIILSGINRKQRYSERIAKLGEHFRFVIRVNRIIDENERRSFLPGHQRGGETETLWQNLWIMRQVSRFNKRSFCRLTFFFYLSLFLPSPQKRRETFFLPARKTWQILGTPALFSRVIFEIKEASSRSPFANTKYVFNSYSNSYIRELCNWTWFHINLSLMSKFFLSSSYLWSSNAFLYFGDWTLNISI